MNASASGYFLQTAKVRSGSASVIIIIQLTILDRFRRSAGTTTNSYEISAVGMYRQN